MDYKLSNGYSILTEQVIIDFIQSLCHIVGNNYEEANYILNTCDNNCSWINEFVPRYWKPEDLE